MLEAHRTLGLAVVAVAAVAAVAAAAAARRRGRGGALTSHLLALAQTVLVAQVALGLLLLSEDRRTADELHYAYGTLALVAVLAPWLYAPRETRSRLVWFAGATLLAGALATRAYMTGG